MKRSLFLTAFSFLVLAQLAWAQVPQTINYQGVLRDTGTKEIVADGNYDLTFNLYNAVDATTPLWTEMFLNATSNAVPVTDGVFGVVLGKTTSFSSTGVYFDEPYWLEIVDGTGTSLGRIELTAVPYAIKSRGVFGPANIFRGSGNVGIGTTTPEAKLHIASPNADGIILTDSSSGLYRASLINFETAGGSLYLNDATGAIQARIRGYESNGIQAYFTSGNVGIGTTTPSAELEVVGVVKADTLQLATAAERWYAIPGSEFHGTSSVYYAGSYVYKGTGSDLYAGVHLPHGAIVTGFAASFYEIDDTVNATIYLNRYADDGSMSAMAVVSTSGEPAYVTISDDIILTATIDNQNYYYVVRAAWPYATPSTDVRLFNVRIKYTVNSPLP